MVDDICAVTKCGPDAVIANSVVNSFVESKQLQLGRDKCVQLHIGSNQKYCPSLKVHNSNMTKSEQQKYLGDIFSTEGTNKDNLEARRNRGFSIVSDILSILDEIPFGQHKIEAGLKMRNSMLINSM